MKNEALLLTSGGLGIEEAKIAKILRFFDVPWRALTVREFLAGADKSDGATANPRLLCSSDTFQQLLADGSQGAIPTPIWQGRFHSVFVFAGNDFSVLQQIARTLSGDSTFVLNTAPHSPTDYFVRDDVGLCGVMAGVRVMSSDTIETDTSIVTLSGGNAVHVISADYGAAFAQLKYQDIAVFLSTSKEIVDIGAELKSGIFDIRDHVLSALPIVLYIKWAFAEISWKSPEANACLVIDDPLLKRRHGFVDFDELLSLMKRHRFSTNIAFIPWNWRRSSRHVVRLFHENPDNYSISVHGCDHTRAEFGISDPQRLRGKTKQALERMRKHEAATDIRHDPVMVFPQGVFSEAAMTVLKRSDFVGAVNNDTISADTNPRPITIAEVWNVALMSYDNFPIFTRRYPWDGVENFAFDLLLGKPVIIVIHHDYCSDHCRRLVAFVDELNALKVPLTWRSLGEVVTRSCRQREISPKRVEVEMYGTELRIQNGSAESRQFVVRRREFDPRTVREVRARSQQLDWRFSEERIEFEVQLKGRESTIVRVQFHDSDEIEPPRENISYEAQTMLRRYLCELRDNYVIKGKLMLAGMMRGNH